MGWLGNFAYWVNKMHAGRLAAWQKCPPYRTESLRRRMLLPCARYCGEHAQQSACREAGLTRSPHRRERAALAAQSGRAPFAFIALAILPGPRCMKLWAQPVLPSR